MSCEPVIALLLTTHATGFSIVTLSFTAVIALPAVYLFGFLRERLAAKISKKHN